MVGLVAEDDLRLHFLREVGDVHFFGKEELAVDELRLAHAVREVLEHRVDLLLHAAHIHLRSYIRYLVLFELVETEFDLRDGVEMLRNELLVIQRIEALRVRSLHRHRHLVARCQRLVQLAEQRVQLLRSRLRFFVDVFVLHLFPEEWSLFDLILLRHDRVRVRTVPALN